ncbi:MAG: electron transfer flavoprotein subunit alpha/FixB family protein [Deltaproteobacteria bacterium]|nr:electron transfer flavoprotein subunit alpha/FixB family protein [Deltaproteobacteria bacterium]
MTEAVWIFAEQREGELPDSSLELVCEGRRLADAAKGELGVVLFGHRIEGLAEILPPYGADSVFLLDHELFEHYHPDLFTSTLAGLVKAHDPGILLFSATTIGQDLAPRVAARLRTTLVPGCDRLDISDDGSLLQTRLAFQNKVHATITCPGARPQTATLTPGAAKIRKPAAPKETRIIPVEHTDYLKPDSRRVEITGFIKADPRTIDIMDAELIVSGGKGVKDKQSFQLIWDLADALGASVAGSRMAVDNEWIDRERQVGQSGKTVSPDLIISCGISGATAHTFSMRDTKTIIAINEDKAAPIMKMADLAVVGDLHEILPELIKQLKESSAPET